MTEFIVILFVSIAAWFIGWIMGYIKGYKINRIYRNMYLKDNRELIKNIKND
jgi:uncharacterized membrane protein